MLVPFNLKPWQRIAAAIAAGIALRFAVGMNPVWWLAWLAPMPLLVLAYRSSPAHARWSTAVATLIAATAYAQFFSLAMPLPFAALAVLAQALVWTLVVLGARRIVLHYRAWWTVLAYPALWAGTDTLMAHLLPDGNWGSYGYSQMDFLPALQITALVGVGGLLFVVSLFASALALALAFGRALPRAWRAHVITALVVATTLSYGVLRMQAPVDGKETVFGLAAIDDYIGAKTPAADAAAIWRQYDQHIEMLAAHGAQVIVLPEKIAVLAPPQAAQIQQHLAELAARLKVWITVGVGVDDGKSRVNLAWLLSPQGTLSANYQKHHLAPPEREFVPSQDYSVHDIGGANYGLAICKDMHFAAMGRAYGQREVSAMLVPAWDFHYDGRLAAKMTATRGIENGYTVVRASREGWLTISDPYGRMLARQDSAFMPGSALLAKAVVSAPAPTIYTRIGDSFGWICAAAATLMLMFSLRRSAAPSAVAAQA